MTLTETLSANQTASQGQWQMGCKVMARQRVSEILPRVAISTERMKAGILRQIGQKKPSAVGNHECLLFW